MDRNQLQELFFIAPIVNLPSIFQNGILSHTRAENLPHRSVALQPVQDKRAQVVIPNGPRLHEYANLYICARNPMLFKRKAEPICVLGVSPEVVDWNGVVISDSNAGSNYLRFAAAPAGLQIVDYDMTFAESWRDSDQLAYWRKSAAKCAEVLVPDRVDPRFILKIYVPSDTVQTQVAPLASGRPVVVDDHMFFL